MFEPVATETVHRLEVITGTGRRRQFSDEFKARVVEETLIVRGGAPAWVDAAAIVLVATTGAVAGAAVRC
jgi:transposase-like protein